MPKRTNPLTISPFQGFPATLTRGAIEDIHNAANAIYVMTTLLSNSAIEHQDEDGEPLDGFYEEGLRDGIIALSSLIRQRMEEAENRPEDEAVYRSRIASLHRGQEVLS